MTRLVIWAHGFVGHYQDWRRVSVPMWDAGSKGWLVHCGCGKSWAL